MPLAVQQGGAEALMMHLLRQGSERYEFLCIFLGDGPLVEETRSMGYQTDVVLTTRVSDLKNYIWSIFGLRRWMKRERPDLVFSWMSKAHLYGAPAVVMLGAKVIWFQQGISNGGKMDRLITCLPADRVLCCSGAAEQAQLRIFPRRDTVVCYPGVVFPASEPISMLEARKQLNLPSEARIFGMVARLERWKGPHILIQAARLVANTHPGAYCFIAGGAHPRDPEYAQELQILAAESGLGERLLLVGQRPAEEIPLWQASADFVIHPVTGAEPFGMAVVEAMGMGKVVIATNAGGPREIIKDGVDGLLLPPGDPQALADAIVQLLEDPLRVQKIEQNALTRGRSFSVAQFATRIEEIMTEALQRRN